MVLINRSHYLALRCNINLVYISYRTKGIWEGGARVAGTGGENEVVGEYKLERKPLS